MTRHSLYYILEGWSYLLDRGEAEITLNQIADCFHKRKVNFLLIEQFYDSLKWFETSSEGLTDDEIMYRIGNMLGNKEFSAVTKFIQIENSGPPYYTISVANIDETIAQFPTWFEEFTGMTLDDFSKKLFGK